MKILITGGAGFIGANYVFYMLKEHPDYDIVCLDALTYAGNLETLDMKIHPAGELIPGGAAVEHDYALLQAIGIAMD